MVNAQLRNEKLYRLDLDAEKIKRKYLGGTSMRDIARELNCSDKAIFDRLHDSKIIIREKNEAPKLRLNISKEKIIDLYLNKKMGVRSVAGKLGCCAETIERRMKLWGIPRRSVQEAMKIQVERNGGHSHNYKGGRRFSDGGYILIYMPEHSRATQSGKCYVLEHIVVWENYHKKRLPNGYIIHHLNGIKTDNRPENLFAMKRGEHMRLAEPYKKRIRKLEEEINRLNGEVVTS